MPAKSTSIRYGSVAVAIHWLTALMILMLLTTGLLAAGQADPAAKLALLRAHIPTGVAVLLLTVLRIIWWLVADPRRPALPPGQPAWQKLVAKAVHPALYIIVLVSGASGIAILVHAGALPAILGGAALPDLNAVPAYTVHYLASRLMLGLLVLHVGAALYHQFIRHDHLLARMGLGPAA